MTLMWALERWVGFLIGIGCKVQMEHRPLILLFELITASKLEPRLSSTVVSFDFAIQHAPSKLLCTAD